MEDMKLDSSDENTSLKHNTKQGQNTHREIKG